MLLILIKQMQSKQKKKKWIELKEIKKSNRKLLEELKKQLKDDLKVEITELEYKDTQPAKIRYKN